MFFLGILIALICFLFLGGSIPLMIVVVFAMIFDTYFRTKKIRNDLLSIKLKLGFDDEDTLNYKMMMEEKESEKRRDQLLDSEHSDTSDDESEQQQPIKKTPIDEEIEAELEQYAKQHQAELSKDEPKKVD